jgi:hypothetical protein
VHTKEIQFNTQDSLGQVFAESLDITPSGAGLEKIAGELHPELAQYIKNLRPDPKYQYVLMTPMGAFEYWGMNVNGDIFPEISLSYGGNGDPVSLIKALEEKWLSPFGKRVPPGRYTNFGYKTFLGADRYKHHVNKDPNLSYGRIPLAVWNPLMHRIELIVQHDREKAKAVGAEEIIRDLDEGKSRQISMGCKVPFDVCTVCGHISRTPRDYCDHLRFSMGTVRNDGTLVGAVNFFPRFFDLSDVFVPAAKESGVLKKVASAGICSYASITKDPSTGNVTHINGEPLEKVAYVKGAASDKEAEIKKEVLPNAGYKAVRDACKCEKDIPLKSLRSGRLPELLTTLGMMGVVMKPHEFQYALLNRLGRGDMAQKLHSDRKVFRVMPSAPRSSFEASDFNPRLASLLSSIIPGRSGFYPHIPKRIIKVVVIKATPNAPRAVVDGDPILSKVAEAYSSYRSAFRDLGKQLNLVVERNPLYYHDHFFSELLTDHMEKMSSSAHSLGLSTPLVPLYLYNAYGETVSIPPNSWGNKLHTQSPASALMQPVL